MYYHRLFKSITSPLLFLFIFLMQISSLVLADEFEEVYDEFYDGKKKEFVEKFEKFKKDGLTAEQIETLTEKLLDVAGEEIEGTGTDTLLKTLNKQAKNTVWILNKKEDMEKLIDFVGDVYAMGSSDVPPDPVDAYKALSKGVDLGAKLAGKIPVLKVVAVPMMESYAQAIKNGNDHIEAIDAATRKKNEFIELGWRSPDYDDELLAATDMEVLIDEKPTEEELQWEEARVIRQANYGKRLSACSAEYNAYSNAANKRNDAGKILDEQKTTLKQHEQSANIKRLQYNDLIPNYKKRHDNFQSALNKRDSEYARMERAKDEGNEQGYQARKTHLHEFEEKLASRKKALHEDYEIINKKYNQYLQAKTIFTHARRDYQTMLATYNTNDNDFKKAKANFEACMNTNDAASTDDSLKQDQDNCKNIEGPSDVWLGKWAATSIYKETTQVWKWWFDVQKTCEGYQIQTHTKSPDKTEVVSISANTLEFIFNDALGTHITLSRNGDIITGKVQQPSNKPLPEGRIEGKRLTNARQ